MRLITEIGGLGKTTLAYRFAEEVVETGAGEIEWVIWLTAKKKTFSALQGKIVEANKVDFSDLLSLYGAILRALSYDMPLQEEEPTPDELADRIIEALTIYTCLIIVDDIDSLLPDEQRETVSALNTIALRTVGRDLPASRLLLTSRIDQGLPQTAVSKISGLEKSAFDKYVLNICNTFKINPIEANYVNALYDATSGSPLFAASIIRLVKLGENLRDVIETWRGQEGEDVRKFAFEREIGRLNTASARLLYAVLLLGGTSVNDLTEILEITPKIVRDRISELQAYHLITTGTKASGDTVICAPDDLVAVAEILRAHLGQQAVYVEEACARAQERSKSDIRTIGVEIRSVLRAWDTCRYSDAVNLARDLKKRFPKSGDVATLLGSALLRATPPKYKEADQELETARRLGCTRPELTTNIIKTKTELRDWPSLYEFTKNLSSNDAARDLPLCAFLLACRKLIDIAKDRGDYSRSADLAIEAVGRITAKISRQRLEPSFFAKLTSSRFDFARNYVSTLDLMHLLPGDKLQVFEGVARLADSGVILSDL